MRLYRTLALGASVLALISACSTGGGSTQSPTGGAGATSPGASSPATSATAGAKPDIVIGSADFYEAEIMAQIYGGALEAQGYKVEYKLKLGARPVIQAALDSGEVDFLPEYLGSALTFLDGEPTGDAVESARLLQDAYESKGITVLEPSPAQDQNAFVVRKETATQYKLTKLSDVAAVDDQLVFGAPPECATNPLCAPGLRETYGIEFDEIKAVAACSADAVTFLVEKEADIVELCSTQPAITEMDLVLLEDDKQLQPAENITPIVRDDYLDEAGDDFEQIINEVSAKMTTEQLTDLGSKFVTDKEDAEDIAAAWLKENGFSQ